MGATEAATFTDTLYIKDDDDDGIEFSGKNGIDDLFNPVDALGQCLAARNTVLVVRPANT